MAQYYVNRNAQNNGDHEVHTSSCIFLPALQNRLDLGQHSSCVTAVRQARNTYLVMLDGDTVVFVEVRYRKHAQWGSRTAAGRAPRCATPSRKRLEVRFLALG
jgi:hypothetical protein